MAPITVTISFADLFCYSGPGTGGLDGSWKPYLWVIMAVLDGGGIKQAGAKLSGSPRYFFSSGSHGNLSTVVPGSTIDIPAPVGSWTTTLQPIELVGPSGTTVEVPGQMGVVAVLLCQGGTPDNSAEAGHEALNQLVQQQLQQFIDGIDLVAVAAQVDEVMAANPNLDEQSAAVQVFNTLFAPVQSNIEMFAPSVIETAIVNHGGINFGSLINGSDQPSGQFVQFFSEDQLAQTSLKSPIVLESFLTGDTSQFPGWGFNLHGAAFQRIVVWTTPLPDSVPPGRWEVSGVVKAYVAEGGGIEWITHIGGELNDGTPWLLSRAHAVQLIESATNSFFVRGPDQSQADVQAIMGDPNVGHPYLKTVPDDSTEDNLSRLPPCAQDVVHTVSI
jgi:hypothetical protein